jgi:hypothetical protein
MSKKKLKQKINQFANWLAEETSESSYESRRLFVQSRSLSTSPDSPVKLKSEDLLGRWPFAQNIYNVIKDTPGEWSKRIGIFGAWGEGKTTVLEFINSAAKDDGNIVVWFNPWEVQNREELWTNFAISIYDAIEKKGLKIPSGLKHKVRKISQSMKPFGRSIKYLESLDKRLENIIGLMNSPLKYWLSPNHGELRNIPNIIKNNKIIVFVDDLDRTRPELVPHLLLSLRELLDMPFMIFILAFDPNVITKTIMAYHPGWEEGSVFIDKIIDFQYWLPDIEQNNKLAIIKSQINKYCDFLNLTSFEKILDLLPENPRRLKKYLRHLYYLKPEIQRHEKNELRWNYIILFQLLKFEYPFIYRKILENQKILYHVSALGIIDKSSEDGIDRYKKNISTISDELKHICSNFSIEKLEQERIVELLSAIGERSTFQTKEFLYYQAIFAEKPHALTWKEFSAFYRVWYETPTAKTAVDWLSNHSSSLGIDRKRVLSEVFDTSINYRLSLLEEAADQNDLANLRGKTAEAEKILVLIEQLCCDLSNFAHNYCLIEVEKFEKLLNMVEKWFHFRNDPAYVNARKNESEFLVKFVKSAPQIANQIFELLEPWSDSGLRREGTESIASLKQELASLAQEYIADNVIERFSQQEGIHELWGHNKMLAEKYILFRLESPVWHGERKAKYFILAQRAKKDDVIRENFIEFVRMLSHYSQEGFDVLNPNEVKDLVSDANIVKAAWDAALSKPLQPRAIGSFQRHHKTLSEFVAKVSLSWPESKNGNNIS